MNHTAILSPTSCLLSEALQLPKAQERGEKQNHPKTSTELKNPQ